MLSFSLPGTASPSWDDPLEMLQACHERIEAQLSLLERLQSHLATYGVDPSAREAMAGIQRYFTLAAPLHHLDEEEDLFPAMADRVSQEGRGELGALVGQLLVDHYWMDRERQWLLGALNKTREEGRDRLDWPRVEAFAARYRAHILKENTQLLPWARRLLPEEMLRRLGIPMGARRGAGSQGAEGG